MLPTSGVRFYRRQVRALSEIRYRAFPKFFDKWEDFEREMQDYTESEHEAVDLDCRPLEFLLVDEWCVSDDDEIIEYVWLKDLFLNNLAKGYGLSWTPEEAVV